MEKAAGFATGPHVPTLALDPIHPQLAHPLPTQNHLQGAHSVRTPIKNVVALVLLEESPKIGDVSEMRAMAKRLGTDIIILGPLPVSIALHHAVETVPTPGECGHAAIPIWCKDVGE